MANSNAATKKSKKRCASNIHKLYGQYSAIGKEANVQSAALAEGTADSCHSPRLQCSCHQRDVPPANEVPVSTHRRVWSSIACRTACGFKCGIPLGGMLNGRTAEPGIFARGGEWRDRRGAHHGIWRPAQGRRSCR